jgi:hypothetical protein
MELVMKLKKYRRGLSITPVLIFICLLICFLLLYAILRYDAIALRENEQINTSQLQKDDCRVLEQNRTLWRNKKIVDYNLVMSLDSHGADPPAKPVLVEVRDKKVISIKPVSKSDKRSFFYYENLETVEKMFDVIQDECQKGSRITISYNQEFGYPESILVYPANSNGMFDLNVEKFEVFKVN